MKTRFSQCLFAGFLGLSALLLSPQAQADLVLSYNVNILETGPVAVGSTINWEVIAEISGAPNSGQNFGIAELSVNLRDSFDETLIPGTVGSVFSFYSNTSGGIFNPPVLQFIAVSQNQQGASTVGAGDFTQAPGQFTLATGSYTVTQVGLHTLQAIDPVFDSSFYFTAAGQELFESVEYDAVSFNSASILVTPEPHSLAMMGIAVCGGWGLRRRQRSAQRNVPTSA